MKYNVEAIFEDYSYLGGVKKKADYDHNFNLFMEKRFPLLEEFLNSEDIQTESQAFCQQMFDAFSKRGKISAGNQMDLNYFAIYYIFPSILKERENGKEICDILRDTWNSFFKAQINYTDFDSLREGFQAKFFGIPIGKN
ncbi:MAG: hypothetical protein K5773_07610 [Pseudobutyrivibrio sp.]|nr:hypothetical protein [Pseudobutyrivibrio sp.]